MATFTADFQQMTFKEPSFRHSLAATGVDPAMAYSMPVQTKKTRLAPRVVNGTRPHLLVFSALSESPQEIDSYTFRDIRIQQALVTPDDDDGIEILFNMRPPRLSTDDSLQCWDFNTSSVSPEGHVKNHMTGSIRLNTNRRRALARAVPNLPQRASGRHWNQALKKFGFNYGPTFQDMDNITFDGTSYRAQATTNLKTSLMIVATWAGRVSAMKFTAVPVTAEEIVIWKPTKLSWMQALAQKLSPGSILEANGSSMLTIN
ncbi:polyketide synthase [Fusarium beomiforme]|uniref:Polyketide synthase n=1 Tax=Fusarium beomiforme TaxID=44412 RepID=A0A9P5ADY7_9HYPO|nr:polyketide synthase [Fusarium beomiforme]